MPLSTSRRVGLCALAAAVACTAAAVATARHKFPHGSGQAAVELPGLHLIQAWVRWDAGWYAQIAQDGYWYHPGEQSPVAFFPVYPLAVRGLMALGVNRYVGGVVLSWLFGFIGILVFARWARRLTDERTAFRASLLLILYPYAIYLYGVMYSDALFLTLVTGAFLAIEEDRPLLAGLLGAVATATRPVAPAVVLGLTLRRLELQRRRGVPLSARDLLPALSALGLLSYMAFLWARFDDPLAFAHVQSAPGWDHVPGVATWLKFAWFKTVTTSISRWVIARFVANALVTLIGLALVFPARRFLGWGYATYIAAVIGIPAISSKDLWGMGRYLIAAFPCFLVLALLMKDRPRLLAAWAGASAVALIGLACAFGATEYIA